MAGLFTESSDEDLFKPTPEAERTPSVSKQ